MADIVIQSSTQPEIVVEHDDRTVIIQEPDRPKEVVIGAPVAVEGTPTSGANVGGGDAEVFRDKVGFALNFRTISGIGGITVAENGDVIEVDGSGVSTPPGGLDRQVQFNDGGTAFGGADVYWTAGGLLALGGQALTEPALKRNAAALEVRLADDSAFADLSALDFALSGGADTLGTHASRHENGGADEVNVAGLSGLLADPQTPTVHSATHADGGADEVEVEALATSGAVGTVPTSDGAGGLTMTLPASIVDENQIYYVGEHGSDTLNNGRSIGQAFATFTKAISEAVLQTPSATNRFAVVCLDDGEYNEQFTAAQYVDVYAPNAKITFAGTGGFDATILLAPDSHIVFREIEQTGAPVSCCLQLPNVAGTAKVTVETLNATGTQTLGLINLAFSALGVVMLKAHQIFVPATGFGIGDVSSNQGHVHLEVEDIYLAGNNATGISRFSTGTTVGRVAHILDIGGPTGTLAISSVGGFIDINVNTIACVGAWNIGAGATLSMFVNEVSGTQAGAGTINVTIAGQVPLHAATHDDGGTDELTNFLYTPGRTGGQTAYGGTTAGDILTLQGANNTPDLGRVQVNSPIDSTYDTLGNTTPAEAFAFIWSPTATVASFIGGCLQARAQLTTSGAAFIPAVFSNVMTVDVASALGFAADTFINHLPVIRNSGNFNLLNEISFNCGLVHERTSAGTSTATTTTGFSFAPQSRASANGAILTRTDQTAIQCRPTFSTVTGSTVNLGTVVGCDNLPPAVALFQPADGAENLTAQYGLRMQANTFATSGNKAAVYNLMTDAADRFCVLNDGGARCDWGGGQHYDTGQIRQPYDLVGRTLGASGDYQDGWAAGDFFFQQFNGTADQLRLSNPSAQRFLWTSEDGTPEMNFDCSKFSLGAQTGAVGNQVGVFVAPAVTVTVGGEYSQFLLTQAGNITPNANLNIFGWTINAPAINVGTGTVTTAAALNVGGNPSNATNRVGLRIISNPSGGGGVNAALWVTAGRSRFDGVVDINAPIALGGGATATLGTIGASGPTAAAQQEWVQIEVNGAVRWVPVWA